MEKEHYVYCTTNLLNYRKYIGSHSGKIDDSYLGSGVNLKKAIEKYGKDNFIKKILWIGPQEHMREMETYWCEYFNTGNNPLFYNCSSVGTGWESGRKNPKLSKWRNENYQENWALGKNKENDGRLKEISEKLKGKPSGMKGKVAWNRGATGMGGWKFKEEDREKLYWERKKIECEHCGKMIGENNYNVHLRKNHLVGKVVDGEIGRKIAEKLQKFVYVAERDSDRIECLSSREMAKTLNIDKGTVISKIGSGRKTKDGYLIYRLEIKNPVI
jgi:hypothetical protein